MKKLILLVCICMFARFTGAQETTVQQIVEDLLESMGDELSDDIDIQEILEDLEYLRQNPLHINSVTVDGLKQLHLLSEIQISNLMSFREKTGTIYSIYELAAIDGFTTDLLQKIEPFIDFEIQETFATGKRSDGDWLMRSTRTFSPDNAKYEGAPERYYIRFRQTQANYQYGFVAEKDPGESFFSQSNKHGFDYNSAFANLRLGQAGSRIFLGDYHVRFGQGLVAWQGFSMGKSAETIQNFKSNDGIKSYSSTDENQFFRGVAAQLKFRQFTFYPFIARNKLDASIDTLSDVPYFGAFQTSGYHRTGSEIAGENTLTQWTGGGHVTYAYERWAFGLTTIYNRFNMEMDRSDEPYNQFLPEGKDHLAVGFDWRGSVKNAFVFGELAFSKNSGKSLLTGILVKPASNAELSVVYRNINKTYFSYFSNAFAESSRINDEQAIYFGIKVLPAAAWSIAAYVDFFRHQWIKYLTAAPSSGTELLAQVTFSPNRKTSFYLRYFQESKEQRFTSGSFKYNDEQLINRIRFNFSHKLSEQISVKSRAEFSFYSRQSRETGFLILQDVNYSPEEKPFSLNGRLAYFRTDGYNSRLYAYESDLLYSFSIPAQYGNGIRAYLNFRQQFGSQFTVWLKVATTQQFNQGDEELSSTASAKSEIKVQLRYQF